MRIFKFLSAVSLVLMLSACSSVGDFGRSSDGSGRADGAKSMGINRGGGFGDDMDESAAMKLRAPYNQTYYFDFDSNTVHQDDYASVRAQADYLVAHPNARIRLEGNTDIRGSREYNIALGWRRARSVAAIMQQAGVSPNQLNIVSYGAERPAAYGDTDAAYAKNRRVNLVYEAK